MGGVDEPAERFFVDVHTHVVPSRDDGAETVEEGIELCRLAAESGTRVVFATPHYHAAWDQYPWSEARADLFAESFPGVRAGAAELGVDLRRGTEVFPSEVHDHDPAALVLEGTRAVLVEFPGSWVALPDQLALVADACAVVRDAGLVPVLAHPERCREIADDPPAAARFVERGALLCLNGPSLTGGHGGTAERVAWELLDLGLVALVASDGHRASRPPALDEAYAAAVERIGAERARPLFDGSALPWTTGPARFPV